MNKYRDILGKWETPFNKSEDQAWVELEARLDTSHSQKGRTIRFSWKPLVTVAAAAAVIVAIAIFWPKTNLIRREAMTAMTEKIILPDNSVALLNAGSFITYSDDWSKERTLTLSGEAFFEVIKGSSFSVITDNGLVEVLGTSFNVFSREKDFRVECHTGRVKVSAGKSQMIIAPGNAAVWDGRSLVFSQFDLTDGDWRVGEFVFENEPVGNVFEEIERQFGVKIIMPDFGERTYTGRFNNGELTAALEMICLPLSLRFEIQGNNQVTIAEKAR